MTDKNFQNPSNAWWMSKLARISRTVERSGTVTSRERTAVARARGVDVLPLIGSPRFPPVPHVVEALMRAASQHPMPSAIGLSELRAAIATKLARENRINVDPEAEVLVTNGAKQALYVVLASLLDPGDEVIFPTPSYVYSGSIELTSGVPRPVLMSEAEGYRWDREELSRAVTPRTKVLLLNNPINPTGFVPDRDDLQAIADLAERHNLLVLMDEAHEKLIYDGRPYISLASLPDAAGRTITVHSMSKGYNLMGHRVGIRRWPSAPNRLRRQGPRVAIFVEQFLVTDGRAGRYQRSPRMDPRHARSLRGKQKSD